MITTWLTIRGHMLSGDPFKVDGWITGYVFKVFVRVIFVEDSDRQRLVSCNGMHVCYHLMRWKNIYLLVDLSISLQFKTESTRKLSNFNF